MILSEKNRGKAWERLGTAGKGLGKALGKAPPFFFYTILYRLGGPFFPSLTCTRWCDAERSRVFAGQLSAALHTVGGKNGAPLVLGRLARRPKKYMAKHL